MGFLLIQDQVGFGKDSDVYYTDPNSGKVTHKWENNTRLPGGGRWKKL